MLHLREWTRQRQRHRRVLEKADFSRLKHKKSAKYWCFWVEKSIEGVTAVTGDKSS